MVICSLTKMSTSLLEVLATGVVPKNAPLPAGVTFAAS